MLLNLRLRPPKEPLLDHHADRVTEPLLDGQPRDRFRLVLRYRHTSHADPHLWMPGYPGDKDTPMMLSTTPNHKRRMADGFRRATESDPRR